MSTTSVPSQSVLTSTTQQQQQQPSPVVTKDPRFVAGRSLVQRGLANDGAIDIFASLLEEVRARYGDTSIECVPAFYEYGNALLRAKMASKQDDDDDVDVDVSNDEEEKEQAVKALRVDEVRSAAAAAAERRLQNGDATTTKTTMTDSTTEIVPKDQDDDKKPAAVFSGSNKTVIPKEEDNVDEQEQDDDGEDEEVENDDGNDDNDDDVDDLSLALEMMENAFAILEDYEQQQQQGDSGTPTQGPYDEWMREQFPRILLGLGDTLSAMGRHADAADAYSRALELRQSILQEFSSGTTTTTTIKKKKDTIEHLQAHRRVCEATILIAEELLACPPGTDVVTAETQSLIVTANERVSYARGYYDKARDALQEAVFCMGTLASKNIDLGQEKQDICFIATMVMGVGESLAAIEEEEEEETAAAMTSSSTEPVKKKAKR